MHRQKSFAIHIEDPFANELINLFLVGHGVINVTPEDNQSIE
jgi:hypothetical protein